MLQDFSTAVQCVKWGITAGPASPGSPLGPALMLSSPLVPYQTEMTTNSAKVENPKTQFLKETD